MILKPSIGVSCCDLKPLLGDGAKVGKIQSSCYMRSRAAVKSGATVCQRNRRNRYKELTSLWSSFSSIQKAAWATFAETTPLLNNCGEVFFRSGYQWFSSINGVLLTFASAIMINDPPLNLDPPPADIAIVENYVLFCFHSRPALTISFSVPAGQGIEVFAAIGSNLSEAAIKRRGTLMFASRIDIDPIYGVPPDPSIPSSVLVEWFVSLRAAWHNLFKATPAVCNPPRLS